MKSAITSKFQTTIPQNIRKSLKLTVNDSLEWSIDSGKAVVSPLKKPFLKYKNYITAGPGNISKDIKSARKRRMEKYL